MGRKRWAVSFDVYGTSSPDYQPSSLSPSLDMSTRETRRQSPSDCATKAKLSFPKALVR